MRPIDMMRFTCESRLGNKSAFPCCQVFDSGASVYTVCVNFSTCHTALAGIHLLLRHTSIQNPCGRLAWGGTLCLITPPMLDGSHVDYDMSRSPHYKALSILTVISVSRSPVFFSMKLFL